MHYKSLCFKAEASFYEMSGGESFPKGHTLQSCFFFHCPLEISVRMSPQDLLTAVFQVRNRSVSLHSSLSNPTQSLCFMVTDQESCAFSLLPWDFLFSSWTEDSAHTGCASRSRCLLVMITNSHRCNHFNTSKLTPLLAKAHPSKR